LWKEIECNDVNSGGTKGWTTKAIANIQTKHENMKATQNQEA
jgi:hypothetical protein